MEIKINRKCEGEQVAFVVQIGPDNHVCSATRQFWVGNKFDGGMSEDEALGAAQDFADGAYAALTAVAGLVDRFITPEPTKYIVE